MQGILTTAKLSISVTFFIGCRGEYLTSFFFAHFTITMKHWIRWLLVNIMQKVNACFLKLVFLLRIKLPVLLIFYRLSTQRFYWWSWKKWSVNAYSVCYTLSPHAIECGSVLTRSLFETVYILWREHQILDKIKNTKMTIILVRRRQCSRIIDYENHYHGNCLGSETKTHITSLETKGVKTTLTDFLLYLWI